MKTYKNIWGLAVALMAATSLYSCSEEEPTYTPAEDEGVKAHITFAGGSSETFEVEPGTSTFTLTVQRLENEASAAETVALDVTNNEGGVFSLPSSIEFAAGETEKSFTVTVSGAEEGTYYNLSVMLSGSNLSNYTQGNREKSVSFAIMKWESIGTGYWVGNTFYQWWGAPQEALAVEIEKATTPTSTRFRFDSPYEKLATKKIQIGNSDYYAYDAYPYNEPGDLTTPGNKFLIICDSKGNASLSPVNLGCDWGYGEFSCGSVYGNLSDDINTYPLGIYTESDNGGLVVFPTNSLYRKMANYGTYPASLPAYLYLSDQDYIDNQVKEPDYENDYTWQSVEGAYGTYESTAFNGKWKQDVEAAYDPTTEEQVEGLYRFPDLFAKGYSLVFNMTQDMGNYLISTPKAQATGTKALEGDMIYAEIKSGKCSAEDMQMTLNIAFYTVDEEGEKKVDFGTLTETFKWGFTGIGISDLKQGLSISDYAGYWISYFAAYDGSETVGRALVTVTPVEGQPNALAIVGLSADDEYDDTVIAEYDAESGLLSLECQRSGDDEGNPVYMTPISTDYPGYYMDECTFTAGLTADGVFAFVSDEENEVEVNSVRYLALDAESGAPSYWLNSYVPYPMEWSYYGSADLANPFKQSFERKAEKMVKFVKGERQISVQGHAAKKSLTFTKVLND